MQSLGFNSQRNIVYLTLIALVVCVSLISSCSSERGRPNIIYILADDLGYGDLGSYGQERIKTPNLDLLAAEGMRFTDHYAGSTVCAPSRCALITGLHTGHALIRGNGSINSLRPEDITIAEYFKSQEYSTGLFGKWALGDVDTTGHPNKKGFDYFFGYLNQVRAHNYYPDYLWRNDKKVMLRNEVIYANTGYAAGLGSAATNKVDYSHDLITAEALQFVKNNKEQPFFLYLAYTVPHANNEAPLLIQEHGMEVPGYGEYTNENWPEEQKGQAAMISRMDSSIGSLINLLKKLNIDKNTLVVFSSDNGPHREGGFDYDPEFNNSNGELRGIKRDLYEGGIRVPMIAWWPETIEPGGVTSHISAFWDILPTFAELIGADVSERGDGISFLPVLLGKPNKQRQHEYLYWEFHEGLAPTRQAIRKGKWKAVKYAPNEPIKLYNLENDISEKNNLVVEQKKVASEMEMLFREARTDSEYFKLINK